MAYPNVMSLAGRIVDSTGAGINGITVDAVDKADNTTVVGTTTTASTGGVAGFWTISNLAVNKQYLVRATIGTRTREIDDSAKIGLNGLYIHGATDAGYVDFSAGGLDSYISSNSLAGHIKLIKYTSTPTSWHPFFNYQTARGTILLPTTVANADILGATDYFGYDGTNFIVGDSIRSIVDTAPGASNMPTSLVFYKTDGAAGRTEKLRLTSTGNLHIKGAAVPIISRTFTEKTTAGNLDPIVTAAQFAGGVVLRDCNGAGRADTLPTAVDLVAAIPTVAVGDTLEAWIINTSNAAETITLAAGAGNTLVPATVTIAQDENCHLLVRFTNVTSTTEACIMYAMVAGG